MRRWWLIGLVVGFISLIAVVVSGFGIEQKRQRAGLLITTSEATAAAYLNDIYLNRTPLVENDLKPGTYTLRLVADETSQAPFEEQVTLHPGTMTTVTWKPAVKEEFSNYIILEMIKQQPRDGWWPFAPDSEAVSGNFTIKTIPDNGIIALANEETRQFAPFIFTNLPPGPLDYTVTLPSYETQSHTMKVQPGFTILATIKLAKNPPEEFAELQHETEGAEDATQSAGIGTAQQSSGSGSIQSAATGSAVLIKATGYTENGVEVLKVRREATSSAAVLGVVPVGSRLPYSGQTIGDWYSVLFASQSGWVNKNFAALEATKSAGRP